MHTESIATFKGNIAKRKEEYRIVRRWFKEGKRFCIWVTNLPETEYSADNIMAIYRSNHNL